MDKYFNQTLKVMILDGFNYASHAHSEIFSGKEREAVIVGYVSLASSFIQSAKAMYACNYAAAGRDEFDEFFHEFGVFANEVMTNIRTDHSHQWSDIQFGRLKEKYKEVALLLGIVGVE